MAALPTADAAASAVEGLATALGLPRKLGHKWNVYYMSRKQGNKSAYGKSIKLLTSFDTVESFWQVYNHIVRPKDMSTMDVHVFKDGVKPMWEDPNNKRGGKWSVRMRKGLASRCWEQLLLALIGEQFGGKEDVCGVVLSVRFNEDVLSVWTRNADEVMAVAKVKETLVKALQIPEECQGAVEYKRHQLNSDGPAGGNGRADGGGSSMGSGEGGASAGWRSGGGGGGQSRWSQGGGGDKGGGRFARPGQRAGGGMPSRW